MKRLSMVLLLGLGLLAGCTGRQETMQNIAKINPDAEVLVYSFGDGNDDHLMVVRYGDGKCAVLKYNNYGAIGKAARAEWVSVTNWNRIYQIAKDLTK